MDWLKKIYKNTRFYIHILINRFTLLRAPWFQGFLRSTDKRRILLLDTPNHGNLGDHAIVIAEKRFLKTIFPTEKIYEFTQQDYLSCEKEITASLRTDDVILIHGGGFIGTLWPRQEKVFLRILRKLGKYKLTVFPQTVFFEQSKHGRAEKEKLKSMISRCSDLCLFAREQRSYDFATKELGLTPEQCICVPDIVTFLCYDKVFERTDKVLLCLRGDIEKAVDPDKLLVIEKELTKRNLEFSYTDTVIPHKKIFEEEREKMVREKLDEFARCKLVITDRLHGMLMAAITGTPCLFTDNSSRKVSGTYEWIKNLEYVKPLKNIDLFIPRLSDGQVYHYSNLHLQMYYKKMAEIINR